MLSSRLLKSLVLGLIMVTAGCDRQSSEKAQPRAAAGAAEQPGTIDRSHKGSELPEITVTDPEGQELRLTSLKGKPTLINLWATWCAPCIAELPTLNSISNRADLNLRVVTISQDLGDPAKVQTFLDQRGFAQLPAWIDTKGDLPIHYAAPSLPVSIYYDANGHEVWRHAGGRDWTSAETQDLFMQSGS